MTEVDRPAFNEAISRLARVMDKSASADLLEDYYHDLREFDLAQVLRAIDHARQSSRFWPRPAVLREACRQPRQDAPGTAIPAWVDPVAGVHWCDACADTGFVLGLECPGDGACHMRSCGRLGDQSHTHAYTRRCGCLSTNPVIAHDRDEQRKRANTQQGDHA